jgi:hypothetical protein
MNVSLRYFPGDTVTDDYKQKCFVHSTDMAVFLAWPRDEQHKAVNPTYLHEKKTSVKFDTPDFRRDTPLSCRR